MQKIRSFFLTFENKQLEEQYQQDKSIEIQRPVYLFLLLFGFLSNSTVLAMHFFLGPTETWFLNAACIFFVIVQTIVIVIMKKWQYQQSALTFSNIAIGFLQLNIDPDTTTGQEFYSYGSVFTQLQCALSLVSNFNHATFQVLGHYSMRIAITTLRSNRPDYLSIFVGILGCLIMLITIYVKDKSSRRYFIQDLKENLRNKVISFLINKPYFKVQYFENQLIFKLISSHNIHKFPGYQKLNCNGCNARDFLRQYQIDPEKNLERILLENAEHFQEGMLIKITYQKFQFQLRICELDPQFKQFIIIYQQVYFSKKFLSDSRQQKHSLISFLKNNQLQYHQQLFSWGALSILYINKKVITKVNITNLIRKIIKIYSQKFYPNFEIVLICKNNTQVELITFIYQLRMYLIQLIDIIAQLQQKHEQKIYFRIDDKINHVFISFQGFKYKELKANLKNNYIITLIQNIIIDKELDENDQQQGIYLKKIPMGSFYFL